MYNACDMYPLRGTVHVHVLEVSMNEDDLYTGTCPCCGSTVFYDGESDEQVSACENCGWLDTDSDYGLDPSEELDFND